MLKLSRPLCIIDTETTGTLENIDRVIELGVVKLHPDGEETTWRSLFNPGFSIPAEATAVHGITDALVKDSPSFGALAGGIWRSFSGCDVGGFNVGFDTKMLNREFLRSNLESPFKDAKVIDAMRIYHKEHPRDLAAAHKLYLRTEMVNHHSALADAQAARRIIDAQAMDLLVGTPLDTWFDRLVEASKPDVSPAAVDSGGKLVMRHGVTVLAFGKHAGLPLTNVDRGYLEWILKQDFAADFKQIVGNVLGGIGTS